MSEEWRPVPDWPEYQVSSEGQVRSVERVVMRSNGIAQTIGAWMLAPATMKKSGHQQVALSRGGRSKTVTVHVLVATAFHGPRPTGMECRHLNGDPADNRAVNLQWGTTRENHLDRVRHGIHHMSRRTECAQGHPFDEANTYRAPGNPTVRLCRTCRAARRSA